MKNEKTELKDGHPCGHLGCLNHLTHPCEGCGRVAGRPVRIFKINDCDWYAACDLESAIDQCCEDTEMSAIDVTDDPRELTGEEMDKLFFDDGEGYRKSFKEHLQLMINDGHQFPSFFASTEY